MIELDGALVRFPRGEVGPLSLRIPAGAIVGVCGPAAAGKSVLLKWLCGLLRPASGQVRVEGVDVARARGRELAAIRARIGMVFQNDALFDALPVLENVALPLLRRGTPGPLARARAEEALASVGLQAAAAKRPNQLSGGMKKRVGFARALVAAPPIRLLDEPTAGLDPATTRRILDLASEAHARLGGVTIIAGADPGPIWPRCTLAVALDRGRLIAAGPPRDLPSKPEVHALFAPDRPEDEEASA